MKLKWVVSGVLLVVVAVFTVYGLLKDAEENVAKLTFSDTINIVDVEPDYEIRTLTTVYNGGGDNSGIVGGDYFDRFEEIMEVFDGVEPFGDGGVFVFSVNKMDGTVLNYSFSDGDDSEEFKLVSSFYQDVSSLFQEEIY